MREPNTPRPTETQLREARATLAAQLAWQTWDDRDEQTDQDEDSTREWLGELQHNEEWAPELTQDALTLLGF